MSLPKLNVRPLTPATRYILEVQSRPGHGLGCHCQFCVPMFPTCAACRELDDPTPRLATCVGPGDFKCDQHCLHVVPGRRRGCFPLGPEFNE